MGKNARRGVFFPMAFMGATLICFAAQAQTIFSTPVPFETEAFQYNHQIQIANGERTWISVWAVYRTGDPGNDFDIAFSRSTDKGATWSTPALLNSDGDTDGFDDFGSSIATDGAGTWIVGWNSTRPPENVHFARSTDDGLTWTAPALFDPSEASGETTSSYLQFATDGAGNWLAVWAAATFVEIIGIETDVVCSRSTDNGETWSEPEHVNTTWDSDSGDDNGAAVSTDGHGNWVVAWQSNEIPGRQVGDDLDILVARSSDLGQSWTNPELLNAYGVADASRDTDPHVIASGVGTWLATWSSLDQMATYSEQYDGVLASRSLNNGSTWSVPVVISDGTYPNAHYDASVEVDTDGDGRWLATWSSTDVSPSNPEFDRAIFVSESIDDGVTWGLPTLTSTGTDIDNVENVAPDIATDRLGTWILVWSHDSPLIRGAEESSVVSAVGVTVGDSSSGGCFIATAAFGSPMERELTQLRRFRDGVLLNNVLGAAFVDVYYRISPDAAVWLSQHESMRAVVRTVLRTAMRAPAIAITFPLMLVISMVVTAVCCRTRLA